MLQYEGARRHWRDFPVFVLLAIFCGSTRLNESVLNPLSRIMANDWFNFRDPAGSIYGDSCIFFVQVAFCRHRLKAGVWRGRGQLGRSDSRAPRHLPGLPFADRRLCPYLSKAS